MLNPQKNPRIFRFFQILLGGVRGFCWVNNPSLNLMVSVTVESWSPADNCGQFSLEKCVNVRIGRQTDGLDEMTEFHRPIQLEESQVVAGFLVGKERMNPDIGHSVDLTFAVIRSVQVEFAELDGQLKRSKPTAKQNHQSRFKDFMVSDKSSPWDLSWHYQRSRGVPLLKYF